MQRARCAYLAGVLLMILPSVDSPKNCVPFLEQTHNSMKLIASLQLVLLAGCAPMAQRIGKAMQKLEYREKARVELARPEEWACHGGCDRTVSALDGEPQSWFRGRGPFVVVPG